MDTLLVAVVVVFVVVALFLALAKGNGGSKEFPYQLSKYLLSKAERSFYGVIVQAIGNTGLVFSKVRVADVLTPRKGLNKSDWQRAFNAVSSKHFDFIICDPGDCSVKLAIELDDSSHDSSKAQKRDSLLNAACKSAGLPLLRVKAAKGYVISEIQRQVLEAIAPTKVEPTARVVAHALLSELAAPEAKSAGVPTPNSGSELDSDLVKKQIPAVSREGVSAAPACPKCGELMLCRKAKSGSNAGQEFWGCSAFPKCRAMSKIGAEQSVAADS